MRRLLLIFVFLICGVAGWSQQLTNDVTSRLEHLGMDMKRSRWHVLLSYPELQVYENAGNTGFFIVATPDYARYLQNPVLAYSSESGFRATLSDWKENLLHSYQEQLQQLKRVFPQTSSKDFPSGEISEGPFIKTKWGQDEPYNDQCPVVLAPYSRQLTGCVATAMSQLMYYHRYPLKGRGRYVGGSIGEKVEIGFDELRPQWDAMLLEYSTIRSSKQQTGPVAELMGVNARAVSSDFKLTDTASDHLAARTVLVNFWGYSPECKFIRSERQRDLMEMITQNLQEHLPVLVTGGGHSFLCDGQKGDYYHFNLGWRGDANGYYRFLVDKQVDELELQQKVMQEIVCDIRPERDIRTTELSLTLSKPGTLANLLRNKAASLKDVNKLKLSGPLNGKDVALLRRMAGATDAWNEVAEGIIDDRTKWAGQLAVLDLTDATFVEDDDLPYLRIKANKGRFNWQKKEYVVSELTDAEFRKFIKRYVGHGDGYSYAMYGKERCVEFFLMPKAISPLMFFDCQNLKEIVLPKNLKKILGGAFQWCNSLTRVKLPPTVKEVEAGAFAECYLLQEVVVETIPTETYHHVFPFKKTGRYGQFVENRHQGIFEGNNCYTCRGLVKDGAVVPSLKYKRVL